MLCCASLTELFSNYQEKSPVSGLECSSAGGSGVTLAEYHLVTAVYHPVRRLEEDFGSIWV